MIKDVHFKNPTLLSFSSVSSMRDGLNGFKSWPFRDVGDSVLCHSLSHSAKATTFESHNLLSSNPRCEESVKLVWIIRTQFFGTAFDNVLPMNSAFIRWLSCKWLAVSATSLLLLGMCVSGPLLA